jgi:hypothetical protein
MARTHATEENVTSAVTSRKKRSCVSTKAKRSLFIRDKPILSPERMLHEDCGRKSSVAKKTLVVSLERLDARTK